MNWLVRAGMRQGWRRGVLDGNRAWIVVGGLAVIGHLLGRYAGRQTDTVFSEVLAPGESLVIRHDPRT